MFYCYNIYKTRTGRYSITKFNIKQVLFTLQKKIQVKIYQYAELVMKTRCQNIKKKNYSS